MGKSDGGVRDGFLEAKTFDLNSEMSTRINQVEIEERVLQVKRGYTLPQDPKVGKQY